MLKGTSPKPLYKKPFVVVAAFFTALWLVWSLLTFDTVPKSSFRETTAANPALQATEGHPWIIRPDSSSKDTDFYDEQIFNATLGFQKIFILSMPHRSDKRDALTLSAYLTGLEIEFVDGPNGSDVSEKAYPPNWTPGPDEPLNTIGCWRGHMNVYEKMVRERIQSALIMEDDVDWDIMIKNQMAQFARGTRALQRDVLHPLSPYGDSWNLLSTGHCGVWNHAPKDQEYWVSEPDPTVIHEDLRTWSRRPNLSAPVLSGNRSRLVFSLNRFTCLASYALSLEGAARVLYDQAILPHGKPIDVGIAAMCKRSEYGSNECLGAYPMITGVHRPAGDASKNSDRKATGTGRVNKVASSSQLVYPTRLNLGLLLKGETTIQAQDVRLAMLAEINPSELTLPGGRLELVRSEDYVLKEEGYII